MNKLISITVALTLSATALHASNPVVKADTLGFDAASAVTPASLLKGRVSGLRISSTDGNINGSVGTLIRGVNAMRGDSQPLWIVDGVMLNPSIRDNTDAFFQYGEKSFTSPLNTLSFLNEYDIESIEVIKDLSAAAIYGSRGGNGAIIITTKSSRNAGLSVNWHSNVSLSIPETGIPYTKNSVSHNHYLNISSLKNQTLWGMSAYVRQQNGVVDGNDSFFGGLRLNFDTKANRVVWFGMNCTVSSGNMSSIAGTPYFGEPSMTLSMRTAGKDAAVLEGWSSDYDDDATERRITNAMYITLNFTPHLKLHTTAGIDFENNNRFIWFGNGTFFGLESNGAASLLETSVFKYNAQSVLSWDRTFASRHHVIAKAAVDASGDWTKYNTLNGTDFILHELRAKGVQIASSKATLHKYDHDYNTHGGYASLAYSFADIFDIAALYRLDRTPRYDDSKFKSYRSLSGSLDLHRAFMKDCTLVSALSIRGGYGEAGRETYVPYGLYGRYITGDYPQVDPSLTMFYEGLNRNGSNELSVGMDLGLFSDRVSLGFSYYDRFTEDSFFAYCFGKPDDYYWVYAKRSDVFSQYSQIANRGYEADLKVNLVNGKDFKWDLNATGAYNVNQMYEVGEYDFAGRPLGRGRIANVVVKGFPVGSLYGYQVDDTGSYVDVVADGRINDYDKVIIGNPIPKFHGGFGTTLSYKGFVLDILADGAAGFDILNLNSKASDTATSLDISDDLVEKGDYLSLSRVSLAYSPHIPVKWLKGVTFTLSGMNLLTFTKYSGWNPEVNCYGTSSLSAGIDYGSYPFFRTVLAGINLKF